MGAISPLIHSASSTDEIRYALRIISFDQLVEVRIPQSGRTAVVRGYFDDHDAAVRAVEEYDGRVPGIYVNLNPIRRELLARAANRLELYAKTSVTDEDVVRRAWLPIDVDPIRASGISSSGQEHRAAIEKAGEIRKWLVSQGWPEPLIADSGNGAHLLYRIDLPNDPDSLQLCKGVLEAIAFEFDDTDSSIDQTVVNAARIWKLYGTMACKGDSLLDRPHRRAKIISAPTGIEPVSADQLRQVALPGELVLVQASPMKVAGAFDVASWMASHGLEVLRTAPWRDGTRWVLKQCPFNTAHTDASAVVVQFGNGAISFRCHHNGCRDKKWADLRRLIQPGNVEAQGYSSNVAVGSPWMPLELPSNELPSVQGFQESLLPAAFRPFVMDVAERLQCPPDFAAAAVMTFAGGMLGRRMGIRPKRRDDWVVVPNLWGAAIGRAGVMKTPAIGQILKFINKIEGATRETYQQAKAEYEKNQELFAMQQKSTKRVAEDMIKNGDREGAKRLLDELPITAAVPSRVRYTVNDSTVEKLGEILAENPAGLIVVRDELNGFLKGLDKPGNETQRAFMLEAWNGDGRFVYDRISRETVEIDAACVSLFGSIQPGPFCDYLRHAVEHGSGDDGFIQRFQLLVWPDVSRDWRNVDREPDYEGKEDVECAFKFLSTVDGRLGEQESAHFASIPYLRFSNEAQELFDEWRTHLEQRLRCADEPAVIESHLSKYRSLVPSLALICHLVDAGQGAVSRAALERAIQWERYLQTHARRAYSVCISPDRNSSQELISVIRRGALSSPFRARDVYRNGYRGLDSAGRVQTAIEVLESYGALRAQAIVDTGGRATVEYYIHPELLGGK